MCGIACHYSFVSFEVARLQFGFHIIAATKPTYGELIDIFTEVERDHPNDGGLLSSKVHELYPTIPIGRPSRFYDTVQRIVGPTRPSLIGESKLVGSPLASYRKRVWEPRLRNSSNSSML